MKITLQILSARCSFLVIAKVSAHDREMWNFPARRSLRLERWLLLSIYKATLFKLWPFLVTQGLMKLLRFKLRAFLKQNLFSNVSKLQPNSQQFLSEYLEWHFLYAASQNLSTVQGMFPSHTKPLQIQVCEFLSWMGLHDYRSSSILPASNPVLLPPQNPIWSTGTRQAKIHLSLPFSFNSTPHLNSSIVCNALWINVWWIRNWDQKGRCKIVILSR